MRANRFVTNLELNEPGSDHNEMIHNELKSVNVKDGDIVVNKTDDLYIFYKDKFIPIDEMPKHFAFPRYPLRFFENVPELNSDGYGIITEIDWKAVISSGVDADEYFTIFREVPKINDDDDKRGKDILRGYFVYKGDTYIISVFSSDEGFREEVYEYLSYGVLLHSIQHGTKYMVKDDDFAVRVLVKL